jgi:hypothetical protein
VISPQKSVSNDFFISSGLSFLPNKYISFVTAASVVISPPLITPAFLS